MNVVPRHGLLTSVDFITEQALTDDERIVDTRAFFDAGFPYYRNGPICVTESTVKAMARALGCELVPVEDAETVRKIIAGVNHFGATATDDIEVDAATPTPEPANPKSSKRSARDIVISDLPQS